MIRSKGEAGTGNIVEAVRHMREIVGGIKRLGAARRPRSSPAAAKELQAPLDVVREVAETGLAAGAAVLRRRHRHPGRRGADDAARRRGQLRRLGHLQVRATRSAGAGDRRGDDALQGPRARRRGLDRPRRARCRATRDRRAWRRSRWRPPAQTAVPEQPLAIGVLAVQGDFEAHARMLRALGAEPARCARPSELEGLDGLVIPGGEIDHDHARGSSATAGGRDPCASRRGRRADPRHLRGDDRLRREHLGLIDATAAAATPSAASSQSFEADLEIEGIGEEPLRAVFIRAPWVEDARRRGRGAGRAYEGHPVAIREGRVARLRLPPGADRRLAPACALHGDDARVRATRAATRRLRR